MLLTNPRRPGLVHIGRSRAFLALGKKAEAKAALAEALKREPDNAEALELKKQLP
jgi:cytochrome c-type biogenesis protein CcmH/NrfG